jgi:hypothetical protein
VSTSADWGGSSRKESSTPQNKRGALSPTYERVAVMHTLLRLTALFALTWSAQATSACDVSPMRVTDDPFPLTNNATRVLIDGCGRQRNFRGMNSVNKSPPYFPDPANFAPNGDSLSPEMAAIWQSLGLNLVRLGVMWSGAVPHARGGTNSTYLSVLANLTTALYTNHGI